SRRALADENGQPVASEAEALKASSGSIQLLDLAGASLPAWCGIELSPGKADVDVVASLTPTLDVEVKIGPKGGLNPLPELKHFRVVTGGQLDVSAKLHAQGTIGADCTVDLLALAGADVSVPLPPLVFWAGPVPVIVTSEVAPIAQLDVGLGFE